MSGLDYQRKRSSGAFGDRFLLRLLKLLETLISPKSDSISCHAKWPRFELREFNFEKVSLP